MIRSAVKKVMWVGRATVFMVGLAVILAVVLGVASMAFAHTADTQLFHLNHNNTGLTALSKLTGSLTKGVLQVTNNSTSNTSQNATAIGATNTSPTSPTMRATNAGGGTALELNVACPNPFGSTCVKNPPMMVDSSTKVNNLNSDLLDGKDSTEFADASHLHDNRYFTETESDARYASKSDFDTWSRHVGGPLPLEWTYTSKGGTLLISATGSGYRKNTAGWMGMQILVDGVEYHGPAAVYTNEINSHKAFVGYHGAVPGLPAGQHTIRLRAWNEETTTDFNDLFMVSIVEIPD